MKRVLHREIAGVYGGAAGAQGPAGASAPGLPSCQDERPNCFIFRQSVTVLMLSASAAWRRFPLNRSSARSMEVRSCSRKSRVSSPGRRRAFCVIFRRQITKANGGAVGEDDRALDGMLQFAHVPGHS